jgi:hypothetical protein
LNNTDIDLVEREQKIKERMDQVDKRLDNLKQTQNEIDAKVKELKYLESLRDELDLKRMTLKANEDALKRKVESEM